MSSVKDTRKFCSRSIHDWSDARAEAQKRIDEALSKQDVDSIWANVQILDDEKRLESGESAKTAFRLSCVHCGTSCQLGNPYKWHSEHRNSAKCLRARSSTAATSSNAPRRGATAGGKRLQGLLVFQG
jgi:hypothetical protein